MAKNEVGTNVKTENQEMTQNNNNVQQPETPPVAQQPAVATEQKGGFGSWCKAHWKGITAGVLGALGIGGSAVVAYRKGKAAGIASVPVTDGEDYSLNPNNE